MYTIYNMDLKRNKQEDCLGPLWTVRLGYNYCITVINTAWVNKHAAQPIILYELNKAA